MSDVQPQPGDKTVHVGDKIRITTHIVSERVVESVDDECITVIHEDGIRQSFDRTGNHQFEVLERADDPSRDPIGTIRGDRYIRLADYNRNGDWWDLRTQNWTDTPPATEPVTGAVPGTPAAQAQPAVDPQSAESALRLIDSNGCTNYTVGRCWDNGRTRGAKSGADAWCDACVARAALAPAEVVGL